MKLKPEIGEVHLSDLEHSGVKGMHWGQRKAGATGGGGTSPKPKVKSADIVGARLRQHARIRELNTHIDKLNLAAPGSKTEKNEVAKIHELNLKALNHPDHATALRMTRGEKAVLTILGLSIPVAGAVAVASVAGAQVHKRHKIEKVQANGGFK